MTLTAERVRTQVAARMEGGVKVYGSGGTEVRALNGVDIGFEQGRFTAIMGPSGSGKSTLLHTLAGLDSIDSGSVYIGAVELGSLNDRKLTMLRREKLGFIFQAFNLIPTLSAEENITLPLSHRRYEAGFGVVRHQSSTCSVSKTDSIIGRLSCPVASSKEWQRLGPSCPARRSSLLMSRRATSTRSRAPSSSLSCEGPFANWARPS